MLVTPQAAGSLPQPSVVNLYVHTYRGEPIARLEGHGPVTVDWVRETLGPQCRFKIYPVIDPQQVDHTEPYDPHGPPGQSGIGNYAPMTTPHHRIKTRGRWDVEQPFSGIYVWRDPHGAFYLVDHTGTRRLPGRADHLPLVVEIYCDLPAIEWAA